MSETPLWIPTAERAAASQVQAFIAEVDRRHGLRLGSYRDLHAWSVAHPDLFWSLVWDFGGVIGNKGERLVADHGKMPGARYLPDATLNFAENLLRRSDGGRLELQLWAHRSPGGLPGGRRGIRRRRQPHGRFRQLG